MCAVPGAGRIIDSALILLLWTITWIIPDCACLSPCAWPPVLAAAWLGAAAFLPAFCQCRGIFQAPGMVYGSGIRLQVPSPTKSWLYPLCFGSTTRKVPVSSEPGFLFLPESLSWVHLSWALFSASPSQNIPCYLVRSLFLAVPRVLTRIGLG